MSQVGAPGNPNINQANSLQLLQQYQALQRQQQMAQTMMQQGGQQNMSTPNAGIASAGQSLLGATMGANANAQQQAMMTGQPQQPGMGSQAMSWLSNLFGYGNASTNTPGMDINE